MTKRIIKDGHVIEFDAPVDLPKDELMALVDRAIRFAARQEKRDSESPKQGLLHKDGSEVKKGDEITDFRGDKAIVEGWEAPREKGKSGRVYVKYTREDGSSFSHGYYPEVFGLKWKEPVEDVYVEDKISEEEIKDLIGSAMILKQKHPEDEDGAIIDLVFKLHDIGPSAYSPEDMAKIGEKIKKALGEAASLEDAKVGDIPVNSPEEQVQITYTERLKGGKSALTYGMIEEAFKQRSKDDGKTFEAYLDAAIQSLKEDIANAKYIVSGEMKPTRRLLLEDYVKIEHLAEKAGMSDKVNEMKPLIDELSEKLDLNYWKQPKFKKREMRSASRELRTKHRFDSSISKVVKPVFLCSEADLKASYNDAKQGKLPQVFEGNLRKVEKDMEADYDRINQGRDHYLEDPRIVQVLPEIVNHYELAKKYAEDLGYDEIAERFGVMLTTIKKGWGLE